jgi:branched-chain amino acid transport system substrate-binding protein
MLAEGGKTWFLLVADYAFGHQMVHDLRIVISAGGGQVVGEALHPLSTPDFGSPRSISRVTCCRRRLPGRR